MAYRTLSKSREFLLPSLLFLVPLACGWILGREVDRRSEQRLESRIEIISERIKAQIESHVISQEDLISFAAEEALGLDAERSLDPKSGLGQNLDFFRRAQSLVGRRPGIQAINWISKEGVIEMTVSNAENKQALNQDFSKHPNAGVRAAFARAVQSGEQDGASLLGGELTRTPLIDLYQGGKGYAVFHAVNSLESGLVGVLNATFLLPDLVHASVRAEALEDLAAFEIVDARGVIVFSSDGEHPGKNLDYSVTSILDLTSEPLFVRAHPTRAWLAAGFPSEAPFYTLIGALLGLVIGTFSWNLERQRSGQLESEWRLRLVLGSASLGVWDLDVTRQEFYLNAEWLTVLGLPSNKGMLRVDDYQKSIHIDDVEQVALAMGRYLAGESSIYQSEHRIRSASGEWIWIRDVGKVVERGSAGEPKRVVGTQHDITDTRSAEQELERTAARYRAIFEHSPIGLLEQDMTSVKKLLEELRATGITDLRAYFDENPGAAKRFDGLPDTLDMNKAFLNMLCGSTPVTYKENLARMTDERSLRAYEEGLIAFFKGETSCEVDFPLRGLDGGELLYTVRMIVAPWCLDDLSSVFVSLVDNTRLIQQEEERRRTEIRERELQKSESLSLLAGGVAHDFNNLLVPIIGNIELVMDQLPPGSEWSEDLLRAGQAAQRAAELAKQMQIYSGRGEVQSEFFDMNALVSEMSSLLASSLPGKVTMDSELHTGVLGMAGDPTQLRQLVMNLVINASDAIGSLPGVVTVRTGVAQVGFEELEGAFVGPGFRQGQCIFLEVGDTGKGLDEATRRRMFEPFFSTKAAGRGLGMSVVLGIVRGHEGALVVDSALGRGTVIRALLPLSKHAIPRAITSGPRMLRGLHRPMSPATVLLADDEPAVLRFARAALLTINVNVVPASNGMEALERFQALCDEGTPPDLVLLDATMPIMAGTEAMERIRMLDPTIPIVLSSGYRLEGVAMRAAETDRCWFLPKPYGVSELITMVSLVLSEVESPSRNQIGD